ncbi:MAG: DM13 domain-containing protein [Pseudomonadota bacterium]
MKRILLLTGSHTAMLAAGFALGIYLLPILTAPPSPDSATLTQRAEGALFTAAFAEDLRGTDALHWGEGTVRITQTQIVHEGRLSAGPDYRMYLVPQFVEHEDEFLPIKAEARLIGEVNTFDGVILDIPAGVDASDYTTVLIWCEAFSEFIAAAQYR